MTNVRKEQSIKISFALISAIVICLQWILPVNASSSTNYEILEDAVGGGGTARSISPNYQSADTFGGGPGAGNALGSSYQTQTGTTTTSDPALTVAVNTTNVSLGMLSTGATGTGTANFSVTDYTSYGYVVQIIGTAPSEGTHTLTSLSVPTASAAGTEQFGINLRANTSPATFGADPQQMPSSNFSYGVAAANYNIPNQFAYNSGDTIASSPKSSGQTAYTISYIANIATGTPSGNYSGNQTLVVVGTY